MNDSTNNKLHRKLFVINFLRTLRLISKQRARQLADYLIVEASHFFDGDWYLEQYKDVAKARLDPVYHFCKYGNTGTRNPSPFFDSAWYLKQYPDVAKAKMNPLIHYLRYGYNNSKFKVHPVNSAITPILLRKHILKSGLFDAKYYAKRSGMATTTSEMELVQHYLSIGANRNYSPSEKFNGTLYLLNNPDVAKAKFNPLSHYILYGQFAGRHYDSEESKTSMNFCRRPLVSIIVASYNYDKFIQETLDSLLAQTYRNYEIIVVDDGSTDNSVQTIREYEKRSNKVRLIQHPNGENKGLPATVKLGLSVSKGEYIAFCESDDVWEIDHLEKKIALINEFDGVPKVIINDIQPFGHEGRCRAANGAIRERMEALPGKKNRISALDFRKKNWICSFSCCMVAAGTLRECDFESCPRPPNLDWWLWRQTCCNNDIFVVHSKLTRWRMHDSYMTKESISSIILQREFLGRMDRILLERYPQAASDLRTIVEREERFTFVNGKMREFGEKVRRPPSFSVVMATWNRAFCIRTAIDSLLNQTYQNFELIIVDDGSTDGTRDLLSSQYATEIESGKIKVVRISNVGVCKARNIAFKHVKNDWIAYMDSDNEVCPFFLETFAREIMLHPEANNLYAKLICKESKNSVGKPFDYQELIKANFIDLGVYVHKRSLITEAGRFDENMTRLVDWELIVRQCKIHTPIFIDSVVLIYNDEKSFQRITNSVSLKKNMDYFRSKHCGWPTVTTMITTYNHKDYIAKAIDSAVCQSGEIIHDIIISDDGSTDGTKRIIDEYVKKYPDLVHDISPTEHLGISGNMKHCFENARGKYIAILEGDDYWTSHLKLHKQASFLEKNKDCTMVFSRVKILRNGKISLLTRHNGLGQKLTGQDYINAETLNLPTNFSCCMFRTDLLLKMPSLLYEGRLNEIGISFYLETIGKLGYIEEPLSVYRIHEKGTWSGSDFLSQKKQARHCFKQALSVCSKKYSDYFTKKIQECDKVLAANNVETGKDW